MPDSRYIGYGRPLIVDKARDWNHAVAMGQILQGTNLLIEFLGAAGNDMIRFSALIPELQAAGQTGRIIYCFTDILQVPDDGFGEERKSLEDNGILFGTQKYFDIHHNFGLINKIESLSITTRDITRYGAANNLSEHYVSPNSYPKGVSITPDAVRIWFPDTVLVQSEKWRANTNTIVGNPFHFYVTGDNTNPANNWIGFPRYLVTIQEIL
jgi:hypothetical protein